MNKRLIVLSSAMLIAFAITACDNRSQHEKIVEETEKACSDTFGAYYISEKYVIDRLRAPSTAVFAGFAKSKVAYLGNCKHIVSSYVDSQNGFGAQIRSNYQAVIISTGFDGNNYKYRLESLDLK